MRKCSVILFVLLLSVMSGNAQNLMRHFYNSTSVIRYEPAINQYILSGNIAPPLLSGMDNSGPGGPLSRIQLQLLDDQLNTLWLKTYATQTEVSHAMSVQGSCRKLTNAFYTAGAIRTADGGYLICGTSVQSSEISGCTGIPYYSQPFLLKTNSTGAVIWYKRYDVEGGFSAMVEDRATGRLIACGSMNGFYSDGLIVCTDAGGNVLWSRGDKVTDPYPGANLSTSYARIIPFTTASGQFCYALAGNADQKGMGIDGGILITLVDANGAFYHDAMLHQGAFHMFPNCFDVADAGGGKLVLTGSSIDASGGFPCGSDLNSALIMVKLDPMTFVVDFFKQYNKIAGTYSYGQGLNVWRRGPLTRYCISGSNSGTAIYLETDDNGNLLRYTPHNPSDASKGGLMTINTLGNYPVYSGSYPGGTYVVRNNYGFDCAGDVMVSVANLPSVNAPSDHYIISVPAIEEVMLSYSFPYSESNACGVLKPAPTDIAMLPGEQAVSLFPNPAQSALHIQTGNDYMPAEAAVYDLTGREVLRQAVSGTSFSLPVASLLPGVYGIRITDRNGKVQLARFVKE
ncbi:T9SS type A sorting domain-containing protein [Taibaiella koreensis]|uniref:T9SS type A sorting domain-containing protein n=1 Tax=Taibaiella koreensis TaxID=1268548 RepID=UPI000E59EAB7|nr:T9SS type A sorting domain-containing protein [Taibaiella koreensis]